MKDRYKISLHFPDWREGNYYQQNLADGLAKAEQQVVFPVYSGFNFPLSINILRHKTRLLHLHWVLSINGATQKNRLFMYRFLFMFIADIILLRMLGVRIVWTVHNLKSHDTSFPAEDLFSRRLLAGCCYKILAHSKVAADQIAQLYRCPKEKIEIIHHGNYNLNYPSGAEREGSRKMLGLPLQGKVFLAFGGMRPYKGLEELIDAFRQSGGAEDTLVLAGNCKEPAYLESLKDKVAGDPRTRFYVRFISDDEIQYFMAAADVCVFPFKEIFTSGSLILACGFGKAVIAPDTESLKEYLDPKGAVFFDPLRQQESLQVALRQISTKDTVEMGLLNKAVTDQYDWATIAEKVAKFYH